MLSLVDLPHQADDGAKNDITSIQLWGATMSGCSDLFWMASSYKKEEEENHQMVEFLSMTCSAWSFSTCPSCWEHSPLYSSSHLPLLTCVYALPWIESGERLLGSPSQYLCPISNKETVAHGSRFSRHVPMASWRLKWRTQVSGVDQCQRHHSPWR